MQPKIRRVDRGRNHWYVDENGDRVPGVTSILDDGLPKNGLIGWAGNTTAAYAVDHWNELAELAPSARLERLQKARFADRDAAAGRGTEVHKLAEPLARGDEVEVPDAIAGHVEAYVRFLDEWDVQPIVIEGSVYSERHRYAGTLDLIAVLADGRRWLLDVKTKRSGVWGDEAYQLAAYRYADYLIAGKHEQVMAEVDRCGVIWVRADGAELIPVDAGPHTFRRFLYIQQVAIAAAGSRDLKGEALRPPKETPS